MADPTSFYTIPGIPYVWRLQLQPASWRGLQFSVEGTEIRRGRRTSIHEFPYSDAVFVEDLGRGTRIVSLQGFMVGDFVTAQWQAMLTAFEKAGPGVLVHPSLGTMNVSCIEYSSRDTAEENRVVRFHATFIEVPAQNASPVQAQSSDSQPASANLKTASQSDFTSVGAAP